MRTTDQERAEHALTKVRNLVSEDYGNFPSYVKSLPATIITNGVGSALASELALDRDGKKFGHKILFDIIEEWLKQRGLISNDLIGELMEGDQTLYRLIQVEALSYLSWLKKFSTAFLNEKVDGKTNEE